MLCSSVSVANLFLTGGHCCRYIDNRLPPSCVCAPLPQITARWWRAVCLPIGERGASPEFRSSSKGPQRGLPRNRRCVPPRERETAGVFFPENPPRSRDSSLCVQSFPERAVFFHNLAAGRTRERAGGREKEGAREEMILIIYAGHAVDYSAVHRVYAASNMCRCRARGARGNCRYSRKSTDLPLLSQNRPGASVSRRPDYFGISAFEIRNTRSVAASPLDINFDADTRVIEACNSGLFDSFPFTCNVRWVSFKRAEFASVM